LRPQNSEGFCTRCLLESGLEESLAESKVSAPGQSQPLLTESETQSSNVERGAVRNFGDYELIEEIARGGMGVVYRARQPSLGRIVALKMILAGQFASKQMIQRFRGEVTAAALLQHPNIVAIHDVGIHDDQHYFSMDYVEGQNLSQLVGNSPLPPGKAARYVKLIAEAIHYAHQQGILHRDLKPSNVLVDASDQPRITDFGLAKRFGVPPSGGQASEPAKAGTPNQLAEARTPYMESFTLSGQMLGSPNFMPPEQASSQRGKVGRHSDVYGLGAILYHLLTARPPFHAESFESVINQVLNTEPVSPRLLNSSVPPDLETICVKCLQKEPAKRYQSARELANELDRFLHDKPIHARPVTRAERLWRSCRRNPALASLGAALVLVFALGFTGTLWQWRQAMHNAQAEAKQRQRAEENLYTSDMNLAHLAWKEGNLQDAQKLLLAHVPEAGKEDLRGFEWRYLWTLCQDESRFTFTNLHFAGKRHGLALAADGKTVIAANGNTLKWLDCQEQREVQTMTVGTTAIVRLSMAMDRPGLVAYRTDRVKALSFTGEILLGAGLAPEWGHCSQSNDWDGAFALSWDGTLLAASGSNDTVRGFDVKTGQPLGPEVRLGKDEDAFSLAFSPDAKYLACGTAGTKIHILEAPTFKQVNVLTNNTAFVHCLVFDRAAKKLVSGGNDSHVRVWSFPECALMNDLTGHQGVISDLAFSPDGLRLASGGFDHTVRLWTLATARATLLHGHRGAVKSVLFSRDGNQLYTGSDDGTVKVWDVSSRESTNILRHSGYTSAVDFSPDGTLLAVGDWGAQTAVLWQLPGRHQLRIVGEPSGHCTGVKFSPDGKFLATVGTNVQIWNIPSNKRKWIFPTVAGEGSLAFHPLKPFLAVGYVDLRLWDLRNGQQTNLLAAAPAKGVQSAVFSPNGKWIALGMQNGQVQIWDFVTGRLSRSFHQHSAGINALCFSHDGFLLASGGDDNLVVLYDVLRGEAVRLESHRDGVRVLAFAPGDKTLVSASNDGTILFWSVANHQVLLTLAHDGGPLSSVTFSPDGNLMATSGNDGTARLWPAATLDDIAASEKETAKKR
jgi:WD40 repeat protein/serine/threonine protein kinase